RGWAVRRLQTLIPESAQRVDQGTIEGGHIRHGDRLHRSGAVVEVDVRASHSGGAVDVVESVVRNDGAGVVDDGRGVAIVEVQDFGSAATAGDAGIGQAVAAGVDRLPAVAQQEKAIGLVTDDAV